MSEQPLEQRWSPKNGFQTIRTWRGLDVYITGMRTTFVNEEIEFLYTPETEGPYATIRAYFNDAETPNNDLLTTWEKDSNSIEKSIYASPGAQALGPFVLDIISAAVDDKSRLYAERVTIIRNAARSAKVSETDAIEFFDWALLGEESFDLEQAVLKKYITARAQAPLKPYEENVGRVFKRATLIAKENPPKNLMDALNDKYWYKKSSNQKQKTDGRWEIVVEYWGTDVWNRIVNGEAL